MDSNKFELIRQSLGAAESSIRLAKQLLSELESGNVSSKVATKPNGADLPGIAGIFDGENMVSESGEVFPVPANYASKSMLVVGDTLKLVEEGKNKEKRFKQIEHVKRHKSTGILTKKDGKWKVATPEGSYKVLGAAVEHFGADIGTEVTLHLPATNLTVAYGAIESINKGAEKKEEDRKVESKEPPQSAVVEQKEQPKQPEPRKEEKPEEVVHNSKEVKKEPEKSKHEPKLVVKQPEVVAEPKKEVVIAPVAKVEKEVVEKVIATPPAPAPKPVVVATEVPEPSKPATVPTAQPTPEKSMEVASEEEELT